MFATSKRTPVRDFGRRRSAPAATWATVSGIADLAGSTGVLSEPRGRAVETGGEQGCQSGRQRLILPVELRLVWPPRENHGRHSARVVGAKEAGVQRHAVQAAADRGSTRRGARAVGDRRQQPGVVDRSQ